MLPKQHHEHIVEEYPGGKKHHKWMFWKKRRYIVAMLAFIGFINNYTLRANLSMAIVAMVANKSVTDNGTVSYEQEFDWDSKTQGYVLGSFFYGYITTQFFGGLLSAKIGGKRLLGSGIALAAVLTLLTPVLTRISVYLLIVLRTFEGVFEGVTYPCIHSIWSRWAPPMERSRFTTIAFSGSYFGTVIAMPLSAYLADTLGWPSIFYFFGVAALLWFVVWWWCVTESPYDDPRISREELDYIHKSLGNISAKRNIKHPWKKMFKSPAVYALIVAHFTDNWGFYTILTQLPTFMKDVFDFSLKANGFLSCLPYLAMGIIIQFAGQIADWMEEKDISTTANRKIFTCGAFIIHAIFMAAAPFCTTALWCVIFLTIAAGVGVCSWSGFAVNYLDVGPMHASVIMGFSNTLATLPGIFSPIVTGYIVHSHKPEEWQIIFVLASLLFVAGAIIYGVCASGEIQPWAVRTLPGDENDPTTSTR